MARITTQKWNSISHLDFGALITQLLVNYTTAECAHISYHSLQNLPNILSLNIHPGHSHDNSEISTGTWQTEWQREYKCGRYMYMVDILLVLIFTQNVKINHSCLAPTRGHGRSCIGLECSQKVSACCNLSQIKTQTPALSCCYDSSFVFSSSWIVARVFLRRCACCIVGR